MNVEQFVKILDADFFTGVPDSQLKPLCDYLMKVYGNDANHHIIAANEGNCVALAAGYHLSTGKIPVIYMQNSGEGNIINPVASLLHPDVYAIPAIFVIGWRGEPGIHDEPQHIFQGKITCKLLEDMQIPYLVIDSETSEDDLKQNMASFNPLLKDGRSVAFVVRKNALKYEDKNVYTNINTLVREEVIRHIVSFSDEDPLISTTGKISRELFEIREKNHQGHQFDFLTVGSMGHTSSIALGVALNAPQKKIWCVDGDGSAIMHLGAMATIGSIKPRNLIHIVLNNEAHESVGGMPTAAGTVDLCGIAKACGYTNIAKITNYEELDDVLKRSKKQDSLTFIEIRCALGSRSDLGRPTTAAVDNKAQFMRFLSDNSM